MRVRSRGLIGLIGIFREFVMLMMATNGPAPVQYNRTGEKQ
jgi:hypothetical protein